MFNPTNSINQIENQIRNLENLKQQYQQSFQQTPIQQFINATPPVEMEGKILKNNENINDIIVMNRTMFLDESNKKLYIKEKDGTISKEYEIVIPKTKEELKIEELSTNNEKLSQKIQELEAKLNEQSNAKYNEPTIKNDKPNAIPNGNAKPTTKTNTK